jgi:hypothetical protein
MCRLSGSISARSGEASKKYDGLRTMNWSQRALEATMTAPIGWCGVRASGTLPGRRDGARIAGHDGNIQRADVDSQLQRVRRDNCAHRTFAQPLLDLSSPERQVAATIASNPLRRTWHALKIVLQIRRQDFGRQSALGKDDELQVALEEFGRDATGLSEIRATDAELMIDDRRIHEHEKLLAARAPLRSTSSKGCSISRSASSCGLAIVADEHRNTGSNRSGGRCGGDAAARCTNGCQRRRDMRAARRSRRSAGSRTAWPTGMVRKDAGVHHVRVAEYEMGAGADGPPRILRRVAVVGEHANLLAGRGVDRLAHGLQLRELVLGKRLVGKEI